MVYHNFLLPSPHTIIYHVYFNRNCKLLIDSFCIVLYEVTICIYVYTCICVYVYMYIRMYIYRVRQRIGLFLSVKKLKCAGYHDTVTFIRNYVLYICRNK